MRIRITGRFKHCSHRFFCRALRHYAKELLTESQMKGLTFLIKVGEVSPDADAEVVYENERRITLFFREAMSEDKVVSSLAHEMVHAWQYLRGSLRDSTSGEFIYWKGEKYLNELTEENYWFSPWELEAFGLQHGLYEGFIRKYNSR